MTTPDSGLTHVREDGSAHMVDVSEKAVTARQATAQSILRTTPQVLALIADGDLPKGDALAVARVAGIMAAKRTADLIPLCHPLALNSVKVTLEPDEALPGIRSRAQVRVDGKTGVEMEALTAVSVSLLTVYDMCKALDRGMEMGGIRLLRKEGGRSGTWTAESEVTR